MLIYPKSIGEISRPAAFSGSCPEENARGKAANFVCGSFVRFGMRIDTDGKRIKDVRYTTNGCGFALAAAETIARDLQSANLLDLHGTSDLHERVTAKLGNFPCGREHCLEMAVEAFRAGLANFRERVVEEFRGEKALICTCFGVTEETIVTIIEENGVSEVAEVSATCNAGTGCGSCQMLIQELIEAPRD